MEKPLLEYCDSRGVTMRVDQEASVIRGAKVLGMTSRNGHRYLPAAIERAVAHYEGVKVNVNHPKGSPSSPRDYQDRIGVLRNVEYRDGDGLYGDFYFNPKHALSEQLIWDAEQAPENVGFSHNVHVEMGRRDGESVVESITSVHSVDLVADPATTQGLFESAGERGGEPKEETMWWSELTLEALQRQRPDIVEAATTEAEDEICRLKEALSEVQTARELAAREALVDRLLGEYGLPSRSSNDAGERAITSEAFVKLLCEAEDAASVHRMIGERAELVASVRRHDAESWKPKSREQGVIASVNDAPADAAAFARAIL